LVQAGKIRPHPSAHPKATRPLGYHVQVKTARWNGKNRMLGQCLEPAVSAAVRNSATVVHGFLHPASQANQPHVTQPWPRTTSKPASTTSRYISTLKCCRPEGERNSSCPRLSRLRPAIGRSFRAV
jgi:hypothetical protein